MKNENDKNSSNVGTKKERKFEILQAEILLFSSLGEKALTIKKECQNLLFENSKILKFITSEVVSKSHLSLIKNEKVKTSRGSHLSLVE